MSEAMQQKKFRNAMGGYNKEDVNAYIKETDLQNSAAQEELKNQIAVLHAEADALQLAKEQWETREKEYTSAVQALQEQSADKDRQMADKEEALQDLQKRMHILQAQTESQNTVIEKLREEKDSLEEKTTALRESLEVSEARAAVLEQKLAEMQEQMESSAAEMAKALEAEKVRAEAEIAQFKAAFTEDEESTGYKIQMYDRISGQIGDILLGANRNADDILNTAKEDADRMRSETAEELEKNRSDLQSEIFRIRQETEQEAISIRERLAETAETMLSGISEEMHANIENCLKELATCMTEVEYDTETMLQTMQKRYREMNDRIQYYQSCVQEHVDKHLRDMEQKFGIRKNGSSS